MICVTGDIHQTPHPYSLDQPHSDMTEAECGLVYARIAARFGVKVTLFVTGKTLKKELKPLKNTADLDNVELGGHGYDARASWRWLYKLATKTQGLKMGPRFFQARDIRKTVRLFQKKLGLTITSWRSHAYRYDRNTQPLLKENGIRFISDDVEPGKVNAEIVDDIYRVPINVVPDHDHMIHGHYSAEVLLSQRLGLDKFPNDEAYTPSQWLEVVKEQVESITAQKGVAVILAHPICQEVGDRFNAFTELCTWLADKETIYLSNVIKK